MDYYCYISKTKVDALYERIDPEQIDEWLEKRTVEHEVDLGANGCNPPSSYHPRSGESSIYLQDDQPWSGRNESMEDRFDVFLCHNSEDKPEVKNIGNQLKGHGLHPWLDEWELRPGLPWQRSLERNIEKIETAAVFIGPSAIGPWQQLELEAYLREFVKRQCPVIPVILKGAPKLPKLPLFLEGLTWVDFRRNEPDPLERLIWGITGERRGSRVSPGANVDVRLANLWSLINGDINYGRKGVIHREQKMRLQYAEKLRRVMAHLYMDKAVHNVMHALETREFPGLYYHAIGNFSLAKALQEPVRSTDVVTLHCTLQNTRLSLDCSLQFFSEGNQPAGDFRVNSLNARFFHESQPLTLDTTFLLLSKTTEEIVGSPLYLKLEAGDYSSIL